MSRKPLISGVYNLQRANVKGGWTYISIPEIIKENKWRPGGFKIKGSIDGCAIRQLRLMRTGDMIFLPVNATIRKAIMKQAGDAVKLVLYEDDAELVIPGELLLCLEDEPGAREYFMQLSEGYKREYINWIGSAKQLQTKAARVAKMIEKLLKKQTLSKT